MNSEKISLDVNEVRARLEAYYEKKLSEIPDEALRFQALLSVAPLCWDDLTGEERRSSVTCNFERTIDDEFISGFNIAGKRLELISKRDFLINLKPTTISEFDRKEIILADLEALMENLSKEMRTKTKKRTDVLSDEIDTAIDSCESTDPRRVMKYLKNQAGKPGSVISSVVDDGIKWTHPRTRAEKHLDMEALKKRIFRRTESHSDD